MKRRIPLLHNFSGDSEDEDQSSEECLSPATGETEVTMLAKQRRVIYRSATLLVVTLILVVINAVAVLSRAFHMKKAKGYERKQYTSTNSEATSEEIPVVTKKQKIAADLREQTEMIKDLQLTIKAMTEVRKGNHTVEQNQEQSKPFIDADNSSTRGIKSHNVSAFYDSKTDVTTTLQQQAQLIQELHEKIKSQQTLMFEIATEQPAALDLPDGDTQEKSNFRIQTTPQNSKFISADSLHVMPKSVPTIKEEDVVSLRNNLELGGYKDAWDTREQNDTPVFWHISKAGGSAFKNIIGQCHLLVMASEKGILDNHDNDENLSIVTIEKETTNNLQQASFVNIDTTSSSGLEKGKKLDLVKSRMAEVIVVRNIFQADDLFDSRFRGRIFAIFRHPVERAFSIFKYKKYADWEPTYNADLANMSVEQFVNSRHMEPDWLTRYLSNQMEGPLSQNNLNKAMDILRRKVLVGLLEKKELSMARFEKYFHWKFQVQPELQEACRTKHLGNTGQKAAWSERLLPDSSAYMLLASYNKFDIQLYRYIETLFDEQAQFTADAPDGYRLVGATCCVCDKTC